LRRDNGGSIAAPVELLHSCLLIARRLETTWVASRRA
jgi:hypothetical protein